MNSELTRIIFQIASAGGMVINLGLQDFLPTVTDPEVKQHLPERYLIKGYEAAVCTSAAELDSLLTKSYLNWKQLYDERVKMLREKK